MLPGLYQYELSKAALILTQELFKLREGETFLITADTESDERVVDAVAGAAFAVGAKPIVVWIPAPLGVGKAADGMLPMEAMTALLTSADAWVEFNNQWLLYSTPYDLALKKNPRLRHLCLVGMNVDMMVRCIGRVNYPVLREFQERLVEITRNAKKVRMTTPSGEDVEFENDPSHPVNCELGYADTPGSHMMAGQVAWSPKLDSINGVIVFDGSVVPPVGLLREPIRLTVEKGKIVKVEGGKEAVEFESWLRSFNHPQMFQMAHVCYGFNPGAKLTGDILEDERVWGCTEWGVGNIGAILIPPDGIPAPSHSDGICLNTSVWLDGKLVIDKGQVVDEKLRELARRLGKV